MDLPPGEALSSDPRYLLRIPREERFFRDFGAASRGDKKGSLPRKRNAGEPARWEKAAAPSGGTLSSDPRRILLLPREGRFFRDFGAASRGEKNAPLYKRPAAKTF